MNFLKTLAFGSISSLFVTIAAMGSANAMVWDFKVENSFENRLEESTRIRDKYPDRIPVIVQRAPRSSITDIDKQKFLVPSDLTVAQFMYIIRRRIQLPPEKAMFLFVNKVLPATSATMGTIYEEHKDEDGFLYIGYSGENTFGYSDESIFAYSNEDTF